MKLSSLIDPHVVVTGRDFASLDEAIEAGIRAASAHYKDFIDQGRVLDLVRKREAQSSTVLPTGIAVPHARIEGFGNFIIVPVVPRKPVPTPSGPPLRMVWIVLSEPSSAGTYLNVLASLSRLSQAEAPFSDLLASGGGKEFVERLERSGWTCSKVLKVGDIMSRDVVSVRADATLRDLIDLMYERALRYVPVLDAAGRLVGEVGVLDLLEAGIPDYANRLEGLGFLSELEPMELLLKNEGKRSVSTIMKKSVAQLDPDASVLDAAFRMVRSRKRHFPIVKDGALVGVVSSMDILSKVLRA
jgi:PTS system nitrogen regulatory IIA component